MTANELTNFLNETTEQSRTSRYLSAAIRRAETMFSTDGYTAKEFGPQAPGVWIVTKPLAVNELGLTENGGCYAVTITDDFHHCTCPAFAEWNECKHRLAIAREIETVAAFETKCEREEEARDFFGEAAAHNALVADYYPEAFGY